MVLEGGIGCGKTTMANLLSNEQPAWEFYREPGGTPFGEKVREAVQGKHGYEVDRYAALFGYSASRANLIRGVVMPKLKLGVNVGLERYWYSTWAYQGAEGVPKLLIWAASLVATKNLKPNLVLHYDLLPEIGITRKRGKSDSDRYDAKKLEFHRKVRKNYLKLKKLYPGIWRIIDASKPVEEVFADSLEALQEYKLMGR